MVRSDSLRGSPTKSLAKAAFVALVAASLVVGVDAFAAPSVQVASQQRPEGLKARSASIVLVSVSGVPEPVADHVKKAFAEEAALRDIALSDVKNADYLMRGYLNAAQSPSGVEVTIVFDVFDSAKKRAFRLEDGLLAKGIATDLDPWSALDDAAVNYVVAKGASDLADFLVTAPGAKGGERMRPLPAHAERSPSPKSAEALTAKSRARQSLVARATNADLSDAALP
ncbi:hypothetical protein [Methylocapsa acidiphila]|uniref:hypothetical protein n=1 Tax=Methylocapsa acidiphila TaxID=133552 RepID=UPI000406094C|nr:hypothetical protein [Methylocapsa acidiphila]